MRPFATTASLRRILHSTLEQWRSRVQLCANFLSTAMLVIIIGLHNLLMITALMTTEGLEIDITGSRNGGLPALT